MRIGLGFDIHRLEKGDGVMLGGIMIPSDKKAVGHSDADALCHAIIDALLGAAGLGDIGQHFPDTDPKYRGASSIDMLKEMVAEVRAAGFEIVNIDAVVVTETPRLSEYKDSIRQRIAGATGVDFESINVKGKTAEKLGPIGAGEALCVEAVALLKENG